MRLTNLWNAIKRAFEELRFGNQKKSDEAASKKPDENVITVINEAYVLEKYRKNIGYNWRSATKNKKTYQFYRVLPIFLGAFLTFATAISSTEYISSNQLLKTTFAFGTPLLVVLLTVSNELSRLSRWAENWRDHITIMFTLEKELDKYLASDPDGRDLGRELEKINNIALKGTRAFFKRTLADADKPSKQSKDSEETEPKL